jgi:flagellar hook-length control protein FliK
VGINSSLVTLGSPMPAPKTDAGQASQANNATDPGAQDGSTASSGADAAPASSQKTASPAAQRRTNARTQARSSAAGSTGNPPGADPQILAQESGADFGSVMASALGRSAAGANDSAAPVSIAADTTDTNTTTPATAGQRTPGTADPAAWLAQALMPAASATGAPGASGPAVASASGAGPALIESSADAGSAGVDAQTASGFAAQLAAQSALAAGQSPRAANASRIALNANSAPTPIALNSDAQTAAATAPAPGNINVLADVQKLISGLTGPDSADADADPDAATPTTHTATASASTDTAQAAAALQAASPTRPSALGATTLTIHAPVGSAAFADEVGARATSLAQSGITQAQLQLNPADMGPVQVHITLQAGQASVWFGANHADTRAALEQSLPRLRELFAGAGMPLTDSGVFREPPQQQQTQPLVSSSGARTPLNETQVASTVTQVANVRLSLLDTYA